MMNKELSVPVMSFWPSVYNRICDQTKLLEYRRRFPKNCEYAYMYVSSPVKAICGIVYFGKKYDLEEWKKEYSYDSEIIKRIDKYLDNYKYAYEIKAIQKIKPITLKSLRENNDGFVAPQSYLLLNNFPELAKYIKSQEEFIDEVITNDLVDLLPNNICL
ncbi:hypothetical protein V6U70_09800 [Streptococcus salivarius]|uniref:hypothetical protein n=1 Tax=Streptococcus salivarius TaxID=1304 RepID=UPI00397ABA67